MNSQKPQKIAKAFSRAGEMFSAFHRCSVLPPSPLPFQLYVVVFLKSHSSLLHDSQQLLGAGEHLQTATRGFFDMVKRISVLLVPHVMLRLGDASPCTSFYSTSILGSFLPTLQI